MRLCLCRCGQVCINAVDSGLFCDERLTISEGTWELVHIDVFDRFMEKFGPSILSTVMYGVEFPARDTPYSTFTMPNQGVCVPTAQRLPDGLRVVVRWRGEGGEVARFFQCRFPQARPPCRTLAPKVQNLLGMRW